MSTDELDRYMFSLEGYLRKVDSLKHLPRQALCTSLLPNFGHIGITFLANYTCPQAIRGLQIVSKLIFYAKESRNGEEIHCPALDEFFNQLQDQIIKGKISSKVGFDEHKLTFLLPKYRKTLVLALIKDCLKNPLPENINTCIQRSQLVEDCSKFRPLFFSVILTFCDILQSTEGHWFIGKIIGSFKSIVINQINGKIINFYPSHLHPFLPHLELLDQQLTKQAFCSSALPHQTAEKLCRNLDKSHNLGISEWSETVALLILYPTVADFLISNKQEWIVTKLRA